MQAIANRALQGAIEVALQAAQLPAAGALQQGRAARSGKGQHKRESGLPPHHQHTCCVDP